jgi:hypothetical protein
MNYTTKTPFIKLYEELSKLQEAETAPALNIANTVSQDELDAILIDYANKLEAACKRCRSVKISAQNVIIFLPSTFSDLAFPGIARSYLIGSNIPGWHFVTDRLPVADNALRKRHSEKLANCEIDLTGSWIAFNFYADNPVEAAEQLILSMGLPKDRATFVAPCKALGAKIYKNNAVRGVAIPYTGVADKNTLLNFCITPPMQSKQVVRPNEEDIKDTFSKAVDFTIDFTSAGFRAVSGLPELTRDNIKTENDLLDIAFYIEDLITYYKTGDQVQRANMLALLRIFEVKLTGTGDGDDFKSVQYLGSAGRQERILAKVLQRNDVATKTPYDSDKEECYHYLVSKKFVSSGTDFVNNTSTIDAKIYSDELNMRKLIAKKAHGADFLVVYLKYPKEARHWRVIAMRDIIDFDTAKKLQKLVAVLNEQGSIALVERTDFE